MKTLPQTLELDNMINALQTEFLYPQLNPFGNPDWLLSRDVPHLGLFERIQREIHFMESLDRSKGHGYDIDVESLEKILTKTHTAATHCLSALACNVTTVPARYELGAASMLFRRFEHQMLPRNLQLTGHPLHICGHNGLLEGELINAFIRRIFEAKRKPAYINRIAEHKKAIARTRLKIERDIKKISHAGYPLFCYRLDFWEGQDASLEDTEKHLMSFLSTFNSDEMLGSPVFLFWKRSFLSETGYRYHLIVIFDSRTALDTPALLQSFGHRWQHVTDGSGVLIRRYFRFDDHLSWGDGPQFGTEPLLGSIRQMLTTDLLLRLAPHRNIAHWGMESRPIVAHAPGHFAPTQDAIQIPSPYFV